MNEKNNEVTRKHNGHIEHKHDRYDYWHPKSRIHPEKNKDETIMHKATSMTTTLCGTPTNIAGHGWTNDIRRITCEDCLTIIEIQTRNKINNFKPD